MKQATFGAGCFWGVEADFRRIPGVVDAAVGYSRRSYREPHLRRRLHRPDRARRGRPGHVRSGPGLVRDGCSKSSGTSHDPTQLNRQGPDIGTQYRSVIFYHDDEQKAEAEESKKHWESLGRFRRPIVTQIVPARAVLPRRGVSPAVPCEAGSRELLDGLLSAGFWAGVASTASNMIPPAPFRREPRGPQVRNHVRLSVLAHLSFGAGEAQRKDSQMARKIALRVERLEVRALLSNMAYSRQSTTSPIRSDSRYSSHSPKPTRDPSRSRSRMARPSTASRFRRTARRFGPPTPESSRRISLTRPSPPGASLTETATWYGVPNGSSTTYPTGTFTVTNQLAPTAASATFQVTPPVSTSVAADQATYQVGQPITLTFSETNTSNETVSVNTTPATFGCHARRQPDLDLHERPDCVSPDAHAGANDYPDRRLGRYNQLAGSTGEQLGPIRRFGIQRANDHPGELPDRIANHGCNHHESSQL